MTTASPLPEPIATPPPRHMRLGAILLFGVVGVIVGGIGGLVAHSADPSGRPNAVGA